MATLLFSIIPLHYEEIIIAHSPHEEQEKYLRPQQIDEENVLTLLLFLYLQKIEHSNAW